MRDGEMAVLMEGMHCIQSTISVCMHVVVNNVRNTRVNNCPIFFVRFCSSVMYSLILKFA